MSVWHTGMTEETANRLASRIRDYWQGAVETRIEYVQGTHNTSGFYVVRSDMVNGLPRRSSEGVRA